MPLPVHGAGAASVHFVTLETQSHLPTPRQPGGGLCSAPKWLHHPGTSLPSRSRKPSMKHLSLLVTTLLLGTSAFAAPPSNESISQLLVATRMERSVSVAQQSLDQAVRNSITQGLQGKTLTPQGQKVIDTFTAEAGTIIRKEINWADLKSAYIKLYAETFTQEEVDGLLAFYRSPAGVALLEKMPQVTQKSAAITQQRIGPLVEKLKASMAQTVQDAKAAK